MLSYISAGLLPFIATYPYFI